MNYTNREVVRRLKQYDMFLNSLNLTTDEVQKERICDQLDKIEKQILLETNAEYEEQYMLLLNEEARFFSEEKSRLHKIISLIEERRDYLEDRKRKHRKITGSLVELTTFLGEDKLSSFINRLDIIEKYEENKLRQENIVKEMKTLDVKLSEASRLVKANNRLNDILENKMKEIVSKALDKFNLYSLTGKKEEILKGYETQEYAFNLAKGNLNMAKKLKDEDTVVECDEMLLQVSSLYNKYSEQVNILKLIDIYDKTVTGYDELLEKREKISDILRNISDSELYNEIADELNKQYNTIKLEGQDIEKYEGLKEEREIKNKILYDIEEENSSKEFKEVIDELVKNENRIREENIRKAKQEEYQERQKKLLEEQKIEASRVRRQKLIEEARLKEQQERLNKVKELQEKTVINQKREVINETKPKIIAKEEVVITKNNLDEKINNPLKGKTYDDVAIFSDDFDTDELFENTKIVPNKKLNSNKSLLENMEEKVSSSEMENPVVWEENISTPKIDTSVVWEDTVTNNKQELPPVLPVWEDISNKEEVIDLFKEEEKIEEVKIEDKPLEDIYVENKQVEITPIEESIVEQKQPSIYDILENNKNIIWKTTDSNVNKKTIPVIGNNNLKPQTLNGMEVKNISFPDLNNNSRKEGDVLWKETL